MWRGAEEEGAMSCGKVEENENDIPSFSWQSVSGCTREREQGSTLHIEGGYPIPTL